MSTPRYSLIGAAICSVSVAAIGVFDAPTVSTIRTSPASRATYLAHAVIWRDPGPLSPEDVLEGPAAPFPYTFDPTTSHAGVACTFVQAGKDIGGNSAKFLCRTGDGHDLRLKYWDPETRKGNREVFATVAASRLLWALGFNAVPAMSIVVRCDACPENPHEGSGARRTRRYVAMVQARWQAPVIVSSADNDQGWSWLELDTAIRTLPPGLERARQRMYFDALALLGVFMQHSDRKAEQQRLYCAAPVDSAAGIVRTDSSRVPRLTLFERSDASACPESAVTIPDVGATFGGGGRSSNAMTAKMNLEAWQPKHVFTQTNGECHGSLTVSLRAGQDGEPDPLISEEGRTFLLEQLHRFSADHVRAIFRAARVDELGSRVNGSPGRGGTIDAWVAAFQDKVRQTEVRRCQATR